MTLWYGYVVWLGYTKCSTIPLPAQPVVWELWVYPYLCGTLLIRLDNKAIDYQLIQLAQLDILKFYLASVTYLSLT